MAYDIRIWILYSHSHMGNVMKPQYNYAVKSDREKIFVYPLEERELVYLAQTTGLSKFNLEFTWMEVTPEWVIRAHKHGWVFAGH